MKAIRICLNLVFIAVVSRAEPQERPFADLLAQVREVEVHLPVVEQVRLANGIPVYLMAHNLVPRASFRLVTLGGSIDEPEEKAGLAALMADMVTFSGSTSMPRESLAEFFEQRASNFSGSCGLERCSFGVSSLAHFFLKDIETALEVIANPRFNSDDWEIMKKRSLRSIEQRGENPSSLVSLVLKTRTYPGNLRSRISTTATLSRIAVSDFAALHRRIVRPERMSVALAGDFDRKAVLSLLNDTIGKLKPEGKEFKFDLLQELPAMPAGKVFRVNKNIPQSSLVLRAPGMKHNDPRYTAWRLFDAILGGDSFNSALAQKIRTKNGWAYSVYSSFDSDRFQGSITIAAQTENKNLPEVIREIRRILAAPEEYLTEERLSQAKESMLNKYVFLYETPEQFLNLYLSLLWDDMPANYLSELPERIKAVTIEDVRKIARDFYTPDKFFTVIVGPQEAYPDEQKLTEYIDEAEFR